ncbi:hypothetical protein PG990_005978 [Apiospora arundinis]|uniref:Ankyrin n=1 Tax=Apiospora arundinis TaxID=335852 RepID=A0ABR2JAF7_9PEZI
MANPASDFRYNDPDGDPTKFRLRHIPRLFLCMNGNEVNDAIALHGANIKELFLGYNALQWHCDALSTSPSTIRALVKHGIDVNELDQHKLSKTAPASADKIQHPPSERRTALGYACCNGNVKAVRTLLELGANPMGNLGPIGKLLRPQPSEQEDEDDDTTPRPIYPSPLQDLLSQRIEGPTGYCPCKVHMSHENTTNDSTDDDVDLPALQGMYRMYGSVDQKPECGPCSTAYIDERYKEGYRSRGGEGVNEVANVAMVHYAGQVYFSTGRRVTCLMELLKHTPLEEINAGHDESLPLPMDCLLRSVWYFLGPYLLNWGYRPSMKRGPLDPESESYKELVQLEGNRLGYASHFLLGHWAILVDALEVAGLPVPFTSALFDYVDDRSQPTQRLLGLLMEQDLGQFPMGDYKQTPDVLSVSAEMFAETAQEESSGNGATSTPTSWATSTPTSWS